MLGVVCVVWQAIFIRLGQEGNTFGESPAVSGEITMDSMDWGGGISKIFLDLRFNISVKGVFGKVRGC